MDEITHPVAAVRPRVVTPLKLAIQKAGVRQDWLADQVGTDPAQISDYVRGIHVPRASTKHALVRVLGRHIDGLTVRDLWPEQDAA